MSNFYRVAITVLVGFFSSCQNLELNKQKELHNSTIVSNNLSNQTKKFGLSWQEQYFPEILERIELSKINTLELEKFPSEVSEIRVWGLYDFAPPRCLILRKEGDNFSAILLPPIEITKKNKVFENERSLINLHAPKSGFKFLWNFLMTEEIFTIPDAETVDAHNPYPDAPVTVIETKTNESYRAVMYNGLDTAEKPEAKKVLKMCKVLEKEFNIELCVYP